MSTLARSAAWRDRYNLFGADAYLIVSQDYNLPTDSYVVLVALRTAAGRDVLCQKSSPDYEAGDVGAVGQAAVHEAFERLRHIESVVAEDRDF